MTNKSALIKQINQSHLSLQELKEKIKKLKRSKKLGLLYELYRAETQSTIKASTQKNQKQVWINHLSCLDNVKIDSLNPLEFQYLILMPLYEAQKYNTIIFATRLIVAVLDFAIAIGITNDNPLKTIYALPFLKKVAVKAQNNVIHRASFNHENIDKELKKLVKTFKEKTCLRRQCLLQFSLYFLLRPIEIVSLNIKDLDVKRKLIHARNTKTKLDFPIPLNDELIKLLENTYQSFGNHDKGYIFAGQRQAAHLSSQTLNKSLKDLGYKDILCAHGIRSVGSNFFSHKSKLVPPFVREAILQHSVGKVEKAYRRDDFYLEQRRNAMKIWYEYLDKIYKN